MAEAPETVNDLRKDLKRALALMDERRSDYELGRDFYTGERVEVSASKYVRKIIAANADAYPISLAHIPVDVIVDMIELTSLEGSDARATALLDTVAENNDLEDDAEDWLRKAAYFGDYYVIVDPTEETADGSITAESVKWVGSSPLTTIAMYDVETERIIEYVVKVWQDNKKRWHARLLYQDCTVRLITEPGASAKASAFDLDYPADGEPADAFVFHEGGRVLAAHLAIDGKPYGVPLHRKAWGPQDAVTKISATNLANLEAIGLPARWALLDPMAEIDDDIDEDFSDNGPDTAADESDNGGNSKGSNARAVPGGVTFLRGIKEVGTFESGDGSVFLANQDWYVRAMAVATGIPLFEFDLTGEQPSGESRRRAMSRALKKAKRVRRATGAFIQDIARITLGVLGVDATATATFYPIETSTDKEGIELVAAKIKTGVPVRVALLEAGYPDDQVDEWWPQDAPAVTYDILSVLGTALAQLGTAKTLGVIDDTELADMLPTILTAARNEGPVVAPLADAQQPIDGVVVDPATQLKAKADALGILVRAGADPEEAARAAGLDGLTFPNLPVTVRVPQSEAAQLEAK